MKRLIPHLNDYHGWTRESIADFVEGVERTEAVMDSVETHDRSHMSQ